MERRQAGGGREISLDWKPWVLAFMLMLLCHDNMHNNITRAQNNSYDSCLPFNKEDFYESFSVACACTVFTYY